MSDRVIRAEGLTKRFGGLLAVDDLSFAVATGEVVALLGPNGAGKTTTVRMLACLIRPTEGSAWVFGKDIGHSANHTSIRSRIGLLTESPGLYDRATTRYNLVYFARLYGLDQPEKSADRYLEGLGLWSHREAPTGSLSKGLKQRLAIARALVHDPDLIFLDEPTSGLDPAAARQVRDFLLGLKGRGRSILLTTHNLGEAEKLADRILVMKTRLVAADSPFALRARLFGHRVRIVTSGIPKETLDSLRELPFVQDTTYSNGTLMVRLENPETQNPVVVERLMRNGVAIRWITDDGTSLEDVYMELVHKVPAEEPGDGEDYDTR